MLDAMHGCVVTDELPSSPPSGSTLSDWELWACAKQQIGQYGEAAPEMAAIRADELLASGDLAGHRTWLLILSRIREMQGPRPDETRH